MLKIRHLYLALGLLACSAAPSAAQVSIGINLPTYPHLVRVPGYPVYCAPRRSGGHLHVGPRGAAEHADPHG